MYLSDKSALIGGVAMLLLALGLVIFVATGATIGDNDPFDKAEVAAYLVDVNDSETAVIISGATGIIIDGVISLVVAVAFYMLFHDRSKLLSLLTVAGILVGSAVALIVDGMTILQVIIADDFVNGGPEGLAAGSDSALELGRFIAMSTYALTNVSITALGVGLFALGINLVYSPAGAINPPKPAGYLAMIAGVSAWLSWLVVASDAGFIFFIIQGLASLIFLIWVGSWLVMHRDLKPAMS